MEDEVTVTPSKLRAALATWRKTAKAENWPDRDDASVDQDNAEYLFGLLKEGK